jgi:hypothetical protein
MFPLYPKIDFAYKPELGDFMDIYAFVNAEQSLIIKTEK